MDYILNFFREALCIFTVKCKACVALSALCVISALLGNVILPMLLLLLMITGDIEPNLGPIDDVSHAFDKTLSICHLNTRSVRHELRSLN